MLCQYLALFGCAINQDLLSRFLRPVPDEEAKDDCVRDSFQSHTTWKH